MAKVVLLRQKDTGLLKKGFVGFSWTTLFFGMLPALFRGDFMVFFGGLFLAVVTGALSYGIIPLVAYIVWACFYNKFYTRRLIERGYTFHDSVTDVPMLRVRLGLA